MSSRLDRVLAAIDSGLQSSDETGYTHDRLDRCARCQRTEAVEGGDICGSCRAYLVGDGPEPVADKGINGVVTAIDREGLALLLDGPGGMTAAEFLAQYPRDPPLLSPEQQAEIRGRRHECTVCGATFGSLDGGRFTLAGDAWCPGCEANDSGFTVGEPLTVESVPWLAERPPWPTPAIPPGFEWYYDLQRLQWELHSEQGMAGFITDEFAASATPEVRSAAIALLVAGAWRLDHEFHITEWRRTLLMARRDDVIAAPDGTTHLVAVGYEDHRSTGRTLTLVPLAGGEVQVVTVS